MHRPRPIDPNSRTGLIGAIIILVALVSAILNFNNLLSLLAPGGNLLNWPFVISLVLLSVFVVWFVMNGFWQREYEAHERTKQENENYKNLLNWSEQARMTDVITGVPNGMKLEEDLNSFWKTSPKTQEVQIILIDIRNFRTINREFGFLKGDEVLRTIAQSIYPSMRRNENMYKHQGSNKDSNYRALWKTLYRRYPGGDEFIFLIEGDQSAAIGFVNRLVAAFNTQISQNVAKLLNKDVRLSFQCAIAPLLRNDTVTSVFERLEACYMRAAEGNEPFTICWSPDTFEMTLPEKDFRRTLYAKARELFQVMNITR